MLELIEERIKVLKEQGVEIPGLKAIEGSATEIKSSQKVLEKGE
jgi:hypothetical protein